MTAGSVTHVDGLDVVAEELLDCLSLHRRVDDDLRVVLAVALASYFPVGRGGDAVLVAKLESVDDAEDLILAVSSVLCWETHKVASDAGGVGKGETDDLLGVDCMLVNNTLLATH